LKNSRAPLSLHQSQVSITTMWPDTYADSKTPKMTKKIRNRRKLASIKKLMTRINVKKNVVSQPFPISALLTGLYHVTQFR